MLFPSNTDNDYESIAELIIGQRFAGMMMK